MAGPLDIGTIYRPEVLEELKKLEKNPFDGDGLQLPSEPGGEAESLEELGENPFEAESVPLPRVRPDRPTRTGGTTRTGRPTYAEPDGQSVYSEKTVTFPLDGKWYTFPSVDAEGNIQGEDEVADYVRQNGPIDPITGEEFPSFGSQMEAEDYARQRSEGLLPAATAAAVPAPVKAQTADVEGTVEESVPPQPRLGGALVRSWARENTTWAILGNKVGLGSDEELADAIVANEMLAGDFPAPPELGEFTQDVGAAEGYWDAAKEIVTGIFSDADILPSMMGEQAGSVVTGLGASLAGGLMGAIAGPAGARIGSYIGSGVGGAISDFGAEYVNFLRSAGVDLRDRTAVLAALKDPDLRAIAEEAAAKHGGAVGLASLLGTWVGGKVFGKYLVPDATTAQKIGGLTKGSILDAAVEAGGEYAGSNWAYGHANPGEVWLEGTVSLGSAPLQVGVPVVAEQLGEKIWRKGNSVPLDVENADLSKFIVTDSEAITADFAAREEAKKRERDLREEMKEPPPPPTEDEIAELEDTFEGLEKDDGFVDLEELEVFEDTPEDKEALVQDAVATVYEMVEELGDSSAWDESVWQNRKAWVDHIEKLLNGISIATQAILNKHGVFRKEELVRSDLTEREKFFLFDDPLTNRDNWSHAQTMLRETDETIFADVMRDNLAAVRNIPKRSQDRDFVDHLKMTDTYFRMLELRDKGLAIHDVGLAIAQDYADDLVAKGIEPFEAESIARDVVARVTADFNGRKMKPRTKQENPMLESPESFAAEGRRVARSGTFKPMGKVEKRLVEQSGNYSGIDMDAWLKEMTRVFHKQAKRLGIKVPFSITATWDPLGNYWAEVTRAAPHQIRINLAFKQSLELLTANLAHEFAHYIQFALFDKMSLPEQQQIVAEYNDFRANLSPNARLQMDELVRKRDQYVITHNQLRGGKTLITQLSQRERDYWLSFEEWFAENVANWMLTDDQPLGVVERFFRAQGRHMKKYLAGARANPQGNTRTGNYDPLPGIKAYMDARQKSVHTYGLRVVERMRARGLEINQSVLDRLGLDTYATEQLPELAGVRMLLERHFHGDVPLDIRGVMTEADRVGWLYKWTAGLVQFAKRFQHIEPVQIYVGLLDEAENMKNKVWNRGYRTIMKFNKLSRKEVEGLTKFLYDYMNMDYLPPKAAQRKPTQQELTTLIAKHGLSKQAFEVFQAMADDFVWFLDQWKATQLDQIQVLSDPFVQAEAKKTLEQQYQQMLKIPYFPAIRFGDYMVTIENAKGVAVHREHAFTEREQRRIQKDLERTKLPGETVHLDRVPEQVRPLMGMPPGMLEKMLEQLNLSEDQRKWVENYRFETLPSQSFRHRFRKRRLVPGYTRDFKRAYANYFFHGGNYLAKVTYAERMRNEIGRLREARKPLKFRTGVTEIANYLEDHMEEWLNPKTDFMTLRGLMVFWTFGFSVPAATLNMSQIPLVTAPMLADKFGDLKAIPALSRAMTDLVTYYKQGTLEKIPEPKMQALAQAIQDGTIEESQGREIAALGEGRNLEFAQTSDIAEAWQQFLRWGMVMFSGVEAWNRRVTFSAAWDLAVANPDVAFIQEARNRHAVQYARLTEQGWSHENASAYVAAKTMVQDTQFAYSRTYRPRFMRGKLGTLFIFKTFMTSMLWALGQNKGFAARFAVLMLAAGGVMGLPGAEDADEIAKALAWKLFGKDFNLDLELRKFITETIGNPEFADLVLHGTARNSFGLPQIADMLGNNLFGVDVPLPNVDMSRAIGLGTISPIPFGTLLGPTLDEDTAGMRALQQSVGPAFGYGFHMYKALQDAQAGNASFKNWVALAPRSARGLLNGWSAYQEQALIDRSGAKVLEYARDDPQHMADLMAMTLGFVPTRNSIYWDRTIAQLEAKAYWDTRRSILFGQIWEAYRGQDKEEIARVMKAVSDFNEQLKGPTEAQAIKGPAISTSIKTRAKNAAKKEAGMPLSQKDIPLYESIRELYPTAVDAQPTNKLTK